MRLWRQYNWVTQQSWSVFTATLHGQCSVPAGHNRVRCRNWYLFDNYWDGTSDSGVFYSRVWMRYVTACVKTDHWCAKTPNGPIPITTEWTRSFLNSLPHITGHFGDENAFKNSRPIICNEDIAVGKSTNAWPVDIIFYYEQASLWHVCLITFYSSNKNITALQHHCLSALPRGNLPGLKVHGE